MCLCVCPCTRTRVRATQRRGCNVIIRDRNTSLAQRANPNQCGRPKERKRFRVGILIFPQNTVYLLVIILLSTYFVAKNLSPVPLYITAAKWVKKGYRVLSKTPRALQGETGRSGRGPRPPDLSPTAMKAIRARAIRLGRSWAARDAVPNEATGLGMWSSPLCPTPLPR